VLPGEAIRQRVQVL